MAMRQLLPQSQAFDMRGYAHDFNDATSNGIYRVQGGDIRNAPPNGGYGLLVVFSAGSYMLQVESVVTGADTVSVYYRKQIDGTWYDWNRVATS